jgi:signal transduction histidine kinase/ActR/RegA family two-component response regulator
MPAAAIEAKKPNSNMRELRAYALAIIAVAIAFAARLLLKPFIVDASPFLLFTPAVMIAAFFVGPSGGVVATVLSAVLGSRFFLRTLGEPTIERWDRIALFLLVGTLITVLSVVVRRARERLTEVLWREQKARAEAEAANQAKDDFLALVSHELQTPASVVLGWASLIRSRAPSGDALQRALDAIERNARVQSKLVEDILDVSRIISGTLRLDRQVVGLETIVMAAVEQMRPLIENKGVTLDLQAPSDQVFVLGDLVRLQQVFTNLLSNAAKFTPAGGRISVALAQTDKDATVTVTDTGIGITAAFLPRVFQRFEQDPATLSYSARGLGLGLSIARHFVERHYGSIYASSDGPGKGATFTVTLPLERRRQPGGTARRPDVVPDALSAVSVLVVDDDEETRSMFRAMLERYGARVSAAGSADEALRLIDSDKYNVLLCDVRMPHRDGIALLREIRDQSGPVRSMPAVAVTASLRVEDRDRALDAGFELHLQKPIGSDELAAALLSVTRGAIDASSPHH